MIDPRLASEYDRRDFHHYCEFIEESKKKFPTVADSIETLVSNFNSPGWKFRVDEFKKNSYAVIMVEEAKKLENVFRSAENQKLIDQVKMPDAQSGKDFPELRTVHASYNEFLVKARPLFLDINVEEVAKTCNHPIWGQLRPTVLNQPDHPLFANVANILVDAFKKAQLEAQQEKKVSVQKPRSCLPVVAAATAALVGVALYFARQYSGV